MCAVVVYWLLLEIVNTKTNRMIIVYICAVAVLDLSNWRGSAPVFCGAPKGEGYGEGPLSLKLGGLTLIWGAKPPLAPS